MRYLPGLEPGYLRYELERSPSGWVLTCTHADSRGTVYGPASVRYEGLTLAEAVDVLGAHLDGLGWTDEW